MIMKALIILIALCCCQTQTSSQNNWQLAKSKKGIKVYVRQVSSSDYYSFKAVMSVKSDEKEIIAILKDVANYPKWFAYTAAAKLISNSGNQQQFLMEIDYPWPFSNECMNYTMSFKKIEGQKQKITIVGTNKDTNCAYSLKIANGYIMLEPEKNNTKITYYFHSEPSQNIPSWLINPRIHEMPFQTFISLKKRLQNG